MSHKHTTHSQKLQLSQKNNTQHSTQHTHKSTTPAITLQQLKQHINHFTTLFHKQDDLSSHSEVYLLSSNWLATWIHFQNQQLTNQTQNQPQILLPPLNQDIIDQNFPLQIQFRNPYKCMNTSLKHNLIQNQDYILLSKQIWSLFKKYQGKEIVRRVEDFGEDRKIQMNFKKVRAIVISPTILNQFSKNEDKSLISFNLQLPLNDPMEKISKQIYFGVINDLLDHKVKNLNSDKVQSDVYTFWKLDQNLNEKKFQQYLKKIIKTNFSKFQEYQIYLEGQKLNLFRSTAEDLQLVQTDIIVIELKEKHKGLIFFNEKYPLYSNCRLCGNKTTLDVLCNCSLVCYCSQSCMHMHSSEHKPFCLLSKEEQQQQSISDGQIPNQQKINKLSKLGRMGLKNLGNTCYLNSGVQCLSSILQLSGFYFHGKHKEKINTSNPFGSRGEISRAYASLMAKMIYGDENFVSPSKLRNAIIKFQPMFQGNQQHDAGQLIAFLLDGLHEDLNSVTQKPYTQVKDMEGATEQMMSKESWQNFKFRNQSIYTDYIFGQLKSKVKCSICNYSSTTFDTFTMLTLPIAKPKKTYQKIILMENAYYSVSVALEFDSSSELTIGQIIKKTNSICTMKNKRLIAFLSSKRSIRLLSQIQMIQELRQQIGWKDLVIRSIEPFEDLQSGQAVKISHIFNQPMRYYKPNLSHQKMYFFQKNTTTKQMHLDIFEIYKQIFHLHDYQEQVLNASAEDRPFQIRLVTNSKQIQCCYCSNLGCNNCPLPYQDDVTLQHLLNKTNLDLFQFEIEVVWCRQRKVIQEVFQIKKKSIATQKSRVSLYDCLKFAQNPQKLDKDNQWYCSKCQKFVDAFKQLKIHKAPKILIIILKRFKNEFYNFPRRSGDVSESNQSCRKSYLNKSNSRSRKTSNGPKIRTKVQCPVTGLDLGEFVTDWRIIGDYSMSESVGMGAKYDLFAVSNHYGCQGSGHYTAHCKKGEEWGVYDDSRVEVLDVKNVVDSGAYILFYRRKQVQVQDGQKKYC